jgi:hypothetical protein
MSGTWNLLRTGVVIADLASTDTAIEALQVLPATPPTFASPQRMTPGTSELVNEIAVMFLAYDNAGAIVSSTATLQVIEEVPPPGSETSSAGVKRYCGRAPVTSHPTGRIMTFDARYLHRFTVRVSSFVGVGATTINVFWRPYR